MMTLGEVLKAARTKKEKSLREVERELGNKISNGQLSLLESDEIQQPSPRHLYLLSEYYGLEYAELMRLAGYHMPPTSARSTATLTPGLAFSAPDDLSPENRVVINEMIEYMRSGEGDLARESWQLMKKFRSPSKE